MSTPLREILAYNRWANLTLFEACRSLRNDELETHAQGTTGSVRELLMHIAGGQQTFVLRVDGRQHEGELSRRSAWPGIEKLIEIVAQTSDELIAIDQKLDTESEVDLPFMGKVYRFPKRFFLVHAVAHAAEHRAEVLVALRSTGIETPDLDGWQYASSAGYGSEV